MDIDLYLSVRKKEDRLFSDKIVARLPHMPNEHPLADEWCARAASAARLTHYLSRQPRPLSILDLGCGNGWLSNQLNQLGHRVIGMDQNHYELKQATRVFSENPSLSFLESDIFSAPFAAETFNVILLASVIQYFHDLPALLTVLLWYLKQQGEIHIVDSPLYSNMELQGAVHRSQQYYSTLGFPEMAEQYFHHRASDLKSFEPTKLYAPQPLTLRLKHLLGQTDSPFPWIVIRKENVK